MGITLANTTALIEHGGQGAARVERERAHSTLLASHRIASLRDVERKSEGRVTVRRSLRCDCEFPLTCVKGKCTYRAKVGEACASSGGAAPECEFPFARCNLMGTCVRAKFAAAGEPCEASVDCAGRSLCVSKKCVPSPSYGEACVNDAGCMYPLRCEKGVCSFASACKP